MPVVIRKKVLIRGQGEDKKQKVLTIPKDINLNPDDAIIFLQDDKGNIKLVIKKEE